MATAGNWVLEQGTCCLDQALQQVDACTLNWHVLLPRHFTLFRPEQCYCWACLVHHRRELDDHLGPPTRCGNACGLLPHTPWRTQHCKVHTIWRCLSKTGSRACKLVNHEVMLVCWTLPACPL